MKTNPELGREQIITFTFNNEYWEQLLAYYTLPLWQRLFKKKPEPTHPQGDTSDD